jgi:hypothetical protein
MSESSGARQAAPSSADVTRPSPPANNHDRPPGHPLAALHHALGNVGVLGHLASPAVQPKLEVGAPDDEHEREADAVAGAVMRSPEDGASPSPGSGVADKLRRAPEDEKKQPPTPHAEPTATQKAPTPAPAAAGIPTPAAATTTPAAIPGKPGAAPGPAATPVAATKKAPPQTPAKGSAPGAAAAGPAAATKGPTPAKGPAAAKPPAAAPTKAAPKSPVATQKPAAADPHTKAPPSPKGAEPKVREELARGKPRPPVPTAKPAAKPKTGTVATEHPQGQAPPSAQQSGGPPKVVEEPAPQAPAAASPAPGERKPDEPVLAAKPATPGVLPPVSAPTARTIQSALGGGQPLSPSDRGFFESRLGRDLGGVRVHDDPSAHRAARDVQARALTYGQDIFFASGRHQPGTGAGRELMAHELAHTIQQRPGAKLERKLQRAPDPQPQTGGGAGAQSGGATNVKRDPGTWTLTFPELEVPGFRLSKGGGKYAGALTRPKGYDRKTAAPKPQRDVWIDDTKGDVTKAVPTMLQGIGATLHNGSYFVHQAGKGMPERFYIGDEATLGGGLTTPEWDASGQGHGFRGFEVDHVLELQLGGTNTPDNLELLDRKINGASGVFIMQSVENTVKEYVAGLPENERNDPALKLSEWRANWNLTFEKAVPPKKGAPPEPADSDIWTLEQIKQGKHFEQKGVLSEADPDKLGSKSEVKLFPSGSGGIMTTLHPSEGPAGVKFFKPFKATAAEYFVDDTSGADLATFTFALDATKGLTLAEPPTVTAQRLAGMKYVGSVDRTAARRALGKLGAEKFSPINIDDAEVGPNGIYAEGQIIADLPIVKGAPIDLVLDGPKLTISHTFDLGDFSVPPPLKVTQTTLTVSASSDGEVKAKGRVDAEIEKFGKGFLEAGVGSHEGFSLKGDFNFTSEVFDKARVDFAYSEGLYSAEGELTLAAGKVAGLKGGSAKAKYEANQFDIKGHADFDIPGIKQADIELHYDPTEGTTLTAAPTLDALPGIKSGATLSVTVKEPAGGGAVKLSGHGEAEPDIPGISAKLAMVYDDGAFLAKVEVPFQAGLIDGKITAGATNQAVGDDGLPVPGGASGDVHIFGGGSATVKITPWLSGTAAIRLLPNGEVEVHGELAVPGVNLYEGKELIDKDIVPMIHTDVPIFPPIVLGLGAGLKLKVGYGPGVLSGSIGITYNPSHADQTKLHGALGLHASAHAGLELYTQIGLGLGVTGASVTGNIELGGELSLEANLDDSATIDWSPDRGLVLDNTVKATVEPALVITLSANVIGTLGPLSHEFWRQKLAGVRYGSGLAFKLTWPVHYEEGKPFEPSFDDIKVEAPPLEPAEVAKKILKQYGA